VWDDLVQLGIKLSTLFFDRREYVFLIYAFGIRNADIFSYIYILSNFIKFNFDLT
jgi:hypothetical protein